MKKHYLPLLKYYKRHLILSPLLVLIYVLCETAQPMLMAMIVDDGVMQKDIPLILQKGGIMILLALVAIVVSLWNLSCASKTSTGFAASLRQRLFHQIQTFTFTDIDKFTTASLITRLTNDTVTIQQLILRSMQLLYRAPLMMIVAFLFVLRIDTHIAGFVALSIPLLAGVTYLIGKKGHPLFTLLQQKLDELNRMVRENLINIKLVKSFVREDTEGKKFNSANEDYKETAVHAINVVILVFPVMQLTMNVLVISILWIGGSRNMNAGMEIGKLISLVNYSLQIMIALMFLSMNFMMFVRASASSKRVLEVLNTEPSIVDTAAALTQNCMITQGEITFKKVSFKYDIESKQDVLKEVDFHIMAGEKITITGDTGSAKSTLMQLIPRLYEATQGEILIDGVNIKNYSLNELRNSIGMVQQQSDLFSGSILENLKWGNVDATAEEIAEVARIADAEGFISAFPDKYETILGQNGVNLSGGQKQRLCIARALLKKPKILLMDNSTSAVDNETERHIMHNIKEKLQDATVIMITQRMGTMESSDRVMVMHEGRIESMDIPEKMPAN